MSNNREKLIKALIGVIISFSALSVLGIISAALLIPNIQGLDALIKKPEAAKTENADTDKPEQTNDGGAGKEDISISGIYTDEMIEQYTTGVLITVQNRPVSENASLDMAYIISFDDMAQRLSVITLSEKLLLSGRSIAAIYKQDGIAKLLASINKSFRLNIKYYVCADTALLAMIIDKQGGVETTPDKQEAEYMSKAMNKTIEAKTAKLTGMESMVYALDPISGEYPLSMLKRRAGLVKSAVLNMRKSISKKTAIAFLSMVMTSAKTNMDISALSDIGYAVLKADEMEYKSILMPAGAEATVNADMTISIDAEKAAVLINQSLYAANGE